MSVPCGATLTGHCRGQSGCPLLGMAYVATVSVDACCLTSQKSDCTYQVSTSDVNVLTNILRQLQCTNCLVPKLPAASIKILLSYIIVTRSHEKVAKQGSCSLWTPCNKKMASLCQGASGTSIGKATVQQPIHTVIANRAD